MEMVTGKLEVLRPLAFYCNVIDVTAVWRLELEGTDVTLRTGVAFTA